MLNKQSDATRSRGLGLYSRKLVGLLSLMAVGLVALVVLGCGGNDGSDGQGNPGNETTYPVQTFADQGRQHLAMGQTFDGYNSNPPTSGPHAPAAARWGVYTQPIPKEVLVHNMEHGGVVVWYNCEAGPQPLSSDQCADLHDRLAGVVNRFMGQGKLLVLSPYPAMDHRIALTAWTKLDTFDEFDEARIASFIERYERAFNPEGF